MEIIIYVMSFLIIVLCVLLAMIHSKLNIERAKTDTYRYEFLKLNHRIKRGI
jgi:hypothetical protein